MTTVVSWQYFLRAGAVLLGSEDAMPTQEPGHHEPSGLPRSLLSPHVSGHHYRVLRINDDGSRRVVIDGLFIDVAQALKRILDEVQCGGRIQIAPDFGDAD